MGLAWNGSQPSHNSARPVIACRRCWRRRSLGCGSHMGSARPNIALQPTSPASPSPRLSFGTLGGHTSHGIALATGLAMALSTANAISQSASQQIRIHVASSWQGLSVIETRPAGGDDSCPTPTPPDPAEYTVACDHAECSEAVALLLRGLKTAPKPQFHGSDLADLVSWLQTATPQDIRIANSGVHHALYSTYAAPRVREEFEAARADVELISRLLDEYYAPGHWWTDDYPHVSAVVGLADGTTVSLSSSAQQAFMIPWKVSRSGTTYQTYEPDIGRALASLAPTRFGQKDRLAGTHLRSWLVSEVFQIAFRKAGRR